MDSATWLLGSPLLEFRPNEPVLTFPLTWAYGSGIKSIVSYLNETCVMSSTIPESMNPEPSNPEIEAQLSELAKYCCQQLEGDGENDPSRTEELLKALLTCGYARQTGRSLMADVEKRAKERCRDIAMHRGEVLAAMTGELEGKFNELKQWEAKTPDGNEPPKTPNAGSAGK